jgi:hypothetical protein
VLLDDDYHQQACEPNRISIEAQICLQIADKYATNPTSDRKASPVQHSVERDVEATWLNRMLEGLGGMAHASHQNWQYSGLRNQSRWDFSIARRNHAGRPNAAVWALHQEPSKVGAASGLGDLPLRCLHCDETSTSIDVKLTQCLGHRLLHRNNIATTTATAG